MTELTWVEGVVTQGHRVASGACGDPRFPAGTIRPQLPFLRAAIPDLDVFLQGPAHPGTVNLRLPGSTVEPGPPEHRVPDVRWTLAFGPETFLLSRAWLEVDARLRPVFLYIPDPATKPDHVQAADVVELLAAFIPGLRYGASAKLGFASGRLRIG